MFIILSCHCSLSSVVTNLVKREPFTPDTCVRRVFKRCGWNEVVAVWRRHCIWHTHTIWNEHVSDVSSSFWRQLQHSGPTETPHPVCRAHASSDSTQKIIPHVSLINSLFSLSCCFSAFRSDAFFYRQHRLVHSK